MTELSKRLANLSPAQRRLLEQRLGKKPGIAEPIAIVGMACRFPGAANLGAYWDLIQRGGSAVREIPPERWDVDEFYDADADATGKMATRWLASLDGIGQFDPLFFGISPREASRMDPQQRLLLEVAWEALENGGLPPDRVAGSKTGVFVGIGGTDYSKLPSQFEDYYEHIDAHVGTGNALSISANRVSYILDLHGPSLAVDTACSSALVGLNLAVQSLRNRECDAALAGGVNAILSPEVTIAFSKARMLSPTGRCRPFDKDANGYVRGEGCGILVLKRLTDAMEAGDQVLAVIRGCAVNQDGRTSGITAPNGRSQQEVIRAALAQAGLSTDAVGYIEAHGTGTPLGDPIEVQALSELFKRRREDELPIYVTSVKANVGHLETASAMAGIIKVVLMMQQGQIPPQAELDELNPHIKLDGSRLVIPREALPWTPEGHSRVAGVSSFGFGGTNAHVVLEAASASEPKPAPAERPAHLLALSAKTDSALTKLAEEYVEFLDGHPDAAVADVCFSANTGRAQLNHRLAIMAEDGETLRERLVKARDKKRDPAIRARQVKRAKRPKVAFLFTGQGAQYVGMARQLYETQPTFRRVLEDCEAALREELERPLLSVMFGEDEGDGALLDETAYTQPSLFALEYGLATLWRSWGVEPDLVLGHSVGEFAAACVAGVFSLEDGLRLIARRARLMGELPSGGTMAAVFAEEDRVQKALVEANGSVSIAAANSPMNTVISGTRDAVGRLVSRFEAEGIRTQELTVSHAFHSALMEPMLEEFEEFARGIKYERPQVPLVTNLDGEMTDEAPDAKYWRQHIRSTVRFARGMQRLAESDCDIALEIGPSPTLIGMGRQCLAEANLAWVASLRRGKEEWSTLLGALSELYTQGVDIDWRGFDRDYPRTRLMLPTYPFERSRYWFDEEGSQAGQSRKLRRAISGAVHPLLGAPFPSALETTLYEGRVSSQSPKFLADHQVQGSIVVPGAAYLEIGLAAAEQAFGPGGHTLENVSIQQAMFLPEGGGRSTQVTISPEMGGETTYQVFSAPLDDAGDGVRWSLHASGRIRHERKSADEPPPAKIDTADVRERAVDHKTREEFYQLVAARGLKYGPAFQVLDDLHRTDDESVAVVLLDESVRQEFEQYHLHPALLDGCMQMVASVVPFETDGSYSPYTYVPVNAGRVRLLRKIDPEAKLSMYAVRTSTARQPSPETVDCNVYILDEQGEIVAELTDVRVQRLGRTAAPGEEQITDWLYRIDWQPQPLAEAASQNGHARERSGRWLVFADAGGVGPAVAEQLRKRGEACTLVRAGERFREAGEEQYEVSPCSGEDYARLLDAVFGAGEEPCLGILHLWSLDAESPESAASPALDTARERGCASILNLFQQAAKFSWKKTPAVWMVTCTAQPVAEDDEVAVSQASLWGLGRVAAVEHPDLTPKLVDLDASEDAAQRASELADELAADDAEDQIAWRGGERRVARLVPASEALPAEGAAAPGRGLRVPRKGAFQLRIGTAGSFDSLRYEPFEPARPGPGQVALSVQATGLNFSDVLKAMGLYPGITDAVVPLGIECAGTVTALGEGVDDFQVGDEVLGVAPYAFGSHAVTATYALVKRPEHISPQEACTIPITFLTAYYALVRLAQLEPGERVLIHAGAGGLGQAAIQIAQDIGAEIYSTAGSDHKRDFLRSLGVEHVFNSRTLDFAEEILEVTDREGVDAVLNSLPGDAITESLRILRAYGRFLEVGKTDIYQNRMIGLLPFQDNLSYFAIDLDRMLRQRPAYIRRMFAEVMEKFESKAYKPLPLTEFPLHETVGAYRYMAQRKNIGKIVVDMVPGEESLADEGPETLLRRDGTYVVTGGLGALGLRVGKWLAQNGAGHLILLSRRGAKPEAEPDLEEMRKLGAKVEARAADVTDLDSLQAAIGELPDGFPPLRGVIHAAGLLRDAVILNLDDEQLAAAMAPKVAGAWNLHTVTREAPLDFFVMFSSVAAVLGSPGQGNYAAGNAFLDALAAWRRSQGLPAASINWGPWAGSGMAANDQTSEQMSERGMDLLPPAKALEVLEGVLRGQTANLAVMSAHWGRMLKLRGATVPPLLREVAPDDSEAPAAGGADEELRQELLSADLEVRRQILLSYFTEQLAEIMGMEASQLDVDEPLNTLGLDSLMAIELKNNIETKLQVVLPMARFMEGPSASKLAEQVAEAVGEGTGAAPAPTASEAEKQDKAPLSRGQQALWFLYQMAPESTAYNIADAVRVRGDLDRDAFQRALQAIVDRHAVLRTTFHDDDGKPYQWVHDEFPVKLHVEDASGWSDEQVHRYVNQEVHRPFDLETGPLMRVALVERSDEERLLLFVLHHIVADFWSLVACTDEFRQLYEAYVRGDEPNLPPVKLEYSDFTRWQGEMLAGEEGQKQWDYWKNELAGELPSLNLPTDRPRPPIQTFNGNLAFRLVGPERAAKLKALGEKHGATPHMVLLAAYQVLLSRYSGQDDILVGAPTSGRTRAEFAPVAGYFVNPVVVRGDLSDDPSFTDLLGQIRTKMLGALDHQDYPFPLLVEKLQPERDPSRSPLIQAMFVVQKAQVMHDQGLTPFLMGRSGATLEFGGLTFESMTLEQWVAQFDLSLAASEAGGSLSLGLQYNTDLFDASTIDRLLDHYDTLLDSIVQTPDAPLSKLELLTPPERRTMLVDWNQGEPANDGASLVHERIAEQAARTPDAVAVVCGDERLTYKELDERSNRLAHYLRERGVGPNVRVGICLRRCADLIVAMQGVLKAGGAYVPLDPNYPQQRSEQIITSANMALVVAHEPDRARLAEVCEQVVCLDADWNRIAEQPADAPEPLAGKDDLIYVIYTSGSTGRPKGAGVYHRGFANLVEWFLQDFEIGAEDRSLVITSHGFDLTQKNLYATLMVGGSVHLSAVDVYDPDRIAREIDEGRITLLNCTPSNFYALVADASAEELARLDSLKYLFLGGEPIDMKQLAGWCRHEGFQAQIVNTYGPTECTDICAFHRLEEPLEYLTRPVPVGRPIPGAKLYLVDRHLAAVPQGATGELCIAGSGVGAGYINDDELTAEKFVPDPFSDDPQARLYRTGDLCRYRPNGEIEFVGRADDQIKIRGFRVELGEIEAHLGQLSGVQQAVVVAHEDGRGDKRLAAYVVPEAGRELTQKELVAALGERLPEHMIPAAFMFLEKLPLTPHGKVDRRALPEPDETRPELATGFVAPRDDLELQLASIWEDVLGVQPVGVKDNFFQLGGHSLLAVQLMSRVQKQFGRDLPLVALLRGGTIEALASVLRRSEERGRWSPLVPIQPAGEKPPLFCVHPVGGNVLCYYELAHHLEADQPLYALQSRGVEGKHEPHADLDAMVDEYLGAIREVQPSGPYHLAGWSSGGLVAYELARRLEVAGEEVALVALFDSRVSALDDIDVNDEAHILAELVDFFRRFFGARINLGYDDIKALESDERLDTVLAAAERSGVLPADVDREYLRRFVDVCQANLLALADYRPESSAVPTVLFRAHDQKADAEIPGDLGWGAVVPDSLEVEEVPGDHVSMLTGDCLAQWSDRLNAHLRGARKLPAGEGESV